MGPDPYFLALAEWLLQQTITASPVELAYQIQAFEDKYFSPALQEGVEE